MTDLRSSLYNINESVEVSENTKKRCCSIGVIKCLGSIIFLSGISGISFLLGIRYQNHLEDKDGSL
jgi:hypothetical protein